MKTRNEIHKEWFDATLDILEDYDIYNREQILASRNTDCLEYRAILVSLLMSKGLSDMHIQSLTGLSLQQVYRMKRLALELSRDSNSIYSILLPIIKQHINAII